MRAQAGDVKLSVIDTVSVRLNLVGKRVQVAEDAEHFHMETTKKAGIVQVQGKHDTCARQENRIRLFRLHL
jgi:hypothetical protein